MLYTTTLISQALTNLYQLFCTPASNLAPQLFLAVLPNDAPQLSLRPRVDCLKYASVGNSMRQVVSDQVRQALGLELKWLRAWTQVNVLLVKCTHEQPSQNMHVPSFMSSNVTCSPWLGACA